jgi:CBS domain-containing protein
VTEAEKVVGLISAQDIMDSLNLVLISDSSSYKIREALNIPVERVMTRNPISVEPGDGLSEIIKKMSHHNIGALPVTNEHGIIQGIVTLRDLVGLIGISSDPLNVQVSEAMNTNVITIYSDSQISHAVRLMSERRIRRLPIISHREELLGMLTNKDILKHLVNFSDNMKEKFDRPVSEFLTRDVIRISHEDDVRNAAFRMMIFGVGGLVIDDLPSSKIALITERDLIRTLFFKRSVDFLVNAMQFELETQRAMRSKQQMQ